MGSWNPPSQRISTFQLDNKHCIHCQNQGFLKCQGTFHVEDTNSDSEDGIDSNMGKIVHCKENIGVENT